MINFTAIDFETANRFRASPCQIGLVRVKDGAIEQEWSSFIRPPEAFSHFDPFNVGIHGINEETIADAPRWGELLPEILAFIGDDLVVAHNAAFDMGVLRSAAEADGHPAPEFESCCTLTLSRQTLTLPSYRLPFVADALNVPMSDHHHALADARAVAQVALSIVAQHGPSIVTEFARTIGQGGAVPRKGSGVRGVPLKANAPDVNADPDGYIYGRVVVFTGALRSMTRQEAWDSVARAGGIPEKGTTKRTNILVVGNVDPSRLSPGVSLTGKAKRAFELQSQGQAIELMTESDFLEVIQC